MNDIRLKPILLLGAFLQLVTACNSQSVSNGTVPKDHQCIGSFDAYAYTVPENDSVLTETTLPPRPWQIEALLPPPSVKDSQSSVAITRSVGDYTEVWVSRGSINLSGEMVHEFLIYRADTKEWKKVSGQVEGTEVFVDGLYVTRDGSVWGRSIWQSRVELSGASVLSKYNAQAERFEFVPGLQAIPMAWKPTDQNPSFSEVLLDSNNLFWVLAHNDAIYSYDPATQEVKRRLEIPNLKILQAALAPDGSLFLTKFSQPITFSLQHDELFQFIPATGELNSIAMPQERWPARQQILVDHSGRLWFDTVGWREPDDTWHTLYPNLNKYFWKMEVEADYRWRTPDVFMESSNGFLWYRGEKGLAWFNPQTEDGCWFTTLDTNIVEDQQHTLWMVADQNLYRYVTGQ